MTTQPILPFSGSMDERFREFHEKNPEVYILLVKFAREVKNLGFRKYSIDALMHRIRWHYQVEMKHGARFQLNDHYTSRYSRLILRQEPDLAGFFETRELKTV